MKELTKKIRAFAQNRDWDQFHSPKNLAMALSVEVAEGNRLDTEKLKQIREEIGDVMIYLARLADRLGIDPVQAAEEKMQINEKKYPVEKAKGRAAKYTEL